MTWTPTSSMSWWWLLGDPIGMLFAVPSYLGGAWLYGRIKRKLQTMFISKKRLQLLDRLFLELAVQREMLAELYLATAEGQAASRELLVPCAREGCGQQAMIEPYRDSDNRLCIKANLLCPRCAALDQEMSR